ncbi:hypothetical protein Rsub_08826 [Raphidocelis subcapitata]|uniref:Armadillo repeat-containing protein 8 n=1 Tax=Raphidocelis subcapitata TaxID=307507 RepID=A0A2V0P819_9CHLO|nr:hypothetical protein Rsub_08826 [Raphidocelis subcapitata]|eukprot:GBF96011.1 hypothetical protein Rsub_08826 [Raphidocelis subcapitata]
MMLAKRAIPRRPAAAAPQPSAAPRSGLQQRFGGSARSPRPPSPQALQGGSSEPTWRRDAANLMAAAPLSAAAHAAAGCGSSSDERAIAAQAVAPLATLPDTVRRLRQDPDAAVRAAAARALATAVEAGGDAARVEAVSLGALPPLIALLASPDVPAAERASAAAALAAIVDGGPDAVSSRSNPQRDAAVAAGAVGPLVAALSAAASAGGGAGAAALELGREAARAAANITSGFGAPLDAVIAAGAVGPLVAVLRRAAHQAAPGAAAGEPAGQHDTRDNGRGGGDAAACAWDAGRAAAEALANLADHGGSDETRRAIAAAGALAPLVDLLAAGLPDDASAGAAGGAAADRAGSHGRRARGSAAACAAAAATLAGLARCRALAGQLLAAGAVDALVKLVALTNRSPPADGSDGSAPDDALGSALEGLLRLSEDGGADAEAARAAVVRAGGLPALAAVAAHAAADPGDRGAGANALWAVWVFGELCKSPALHAEVAGAGVVDALLSLLESPDEPADPEAPQEAALLLSSFLAGSGNGSGNGSSAAAAAPELLRAAVEAQLPPLLARLSPAGRPERVQAALSALCWLTAVSRPLQLALLRNGAAPRLVELVEACGTAPDEAGVAASVLADLCAGGEEGRDAVVGANGVPALVAMLPRDQDGWACAALARIVSGEGAGAARRRAAAVEAGAVEGLQAALLRGRLPPAAAGAAEAAVRELRGAT